MSGLFRITVKASGQWTEVRARCLSCAREQAVRHAGAEGTLVWRNPELSTIAVVHEPIRSDAAPGLIAKGGQADV